MIPVAEVKQTNLTYPSQKQGPSGDVSAVCMYCGKVRGGITWREIQPLESDGGRLSHTVCPDCYGNAVRHLVQEIREESSR